MIKKPQILIIVFAFAAFAIFLATTTSGDQAGILSKKSHAEKQWATSGHADSASEAFVHWDDDGEVSGSCAKCHSTHGAVSFFTTGATAAVPIGTTVECEVCHTSRETGTLRNVTSVTFPSGVEVENLGPEAMCMSCHQGRYSKPTVDSYIADRDPPDDDTPGSYSFRNVHYAAAGATQFGTAVQGGYEYDGITYDARFSHVTGYNACITCHNPHTLEVELDACNTCHVGIKDPKNIRYYGSFVDYDGDGDMTEGIYYEVEGFKGKLYAAIQRYAKYVAGTPLLYDSHNYPYFWADPNENGVLDDSEPRFSSFTPRLLRATYNYQFALKDTAGYAHGGKYMIQLMYDSIADLNTKLNTPVSLDGMSRTDEGHFDGSAEAWRHWDGDEEVSSSCAKCHSAQGIPDLIELGENVATDISNGLLCTTCHTSPPSVRNTGPVTFPSGITKDMGDSSNLCLNCHQGRASKFSILSKIGGSAGPYSFTNIHYFPTAAVLYGADVAGGYEYGGKTYVGQNLYPNHMGKFDTCVECHMGTKSKGRIDEPATDQNHNVHKPNPKDCVGCHGYDVSEPNQGADPTKFKFSGIRPASIPDFDGDGNIAEAIKHEIIGLEDALYTQMQTYGTKIGVPIIYDSHSYPYFFIDTNGNGIVDPGEATRSNSYSFDGKMLKAAYNFQMSKKEPHGYIHNPFYVAQLLVDSIIDLGGNVSAYTWR